MPSRIAISNPATDTSILKIENFQKDILGKWTCVATNVAGTSKTDAFVTACELPFNSNQILLQIWKTQFYKLNMEHMSVLSKIFSANNFRIKL